jgi:protein-disulfide isomerase
MTEKKRKAPSSILTSALIAALPIAFIAGLFVGYQLWEAPEAADVVADTAGGAAPRIDIPISDDDPSLGDPDAPVTIIEFSDYECPFCARYHLETFDRIIAEYGDQIHYVYMDLPLTSIHPNAAPAANAAHCAGEQNAFWEFHDKLFAGQFGLGLEAYLGYAQQLDLDMDAFNDCLEDGRYLEKATENLDYLSSLGVPISTPTFFINGQYLAGAQPFSEFARLIDAELD